MRDFDIRRALRTHLAYEFRDDDESLIVDELALVFEDARIDLAVLNGALHGFEIKSDHDSLGRLPAQVAAYGRIFDHVSIVAGARYAGRVSMTVPPWWGVLEATACGGGAEFVVRRQAGVNPSVDVLAVAQLLWRPEAIDLLRERGLARGLARKPRRELAQVLARELPGDELRDEVRQRLRARRQWRIAPPPA